MHSNRPSPIPSLAEPAGDAEAVAPPTLAGVAPAPAKPRAFVIRYVGFRCTTSGREYTLQVADGAATRNFVLLIAHQSFASREARFQDAPDLCSAKLRRALASDPDLPVGDPMLVTAADMLDYRAGHDPRPVAGGARRSG